MDLNSGKLITRNIIHEIPVTDVIIKAVETMAYAQGFKNLKFKNRHGMTFHSADWIAGMDYDDNEEEDNDEEYHQEAEGKDDENEEELKEHEEIDPNEVNNIISDAREEDNPTIHEENDNGNGGEPEQPEAQNDPEDTNIVYNADEEKSQTTESTRRLKLETRPLKGWSQQ